MSGGQIVNLCIGLANVVATVLVAVFAYTLFNKREKIYLKKQEAIYRALVLCDKYLSWFRYSSDGCESPTPARNPEDTTLSITEEARLVYNSLVCSCKNELLIETYLELLFVGKTDPSMLLPTYNKFRNLCRTELGLKAIENLNVEKIFLSRMTTTDLEEHSESK